MHANHPLDSSVDEVKPIRMYMEYGGVGLVCVN